MAAQMEEGPPPLPASPPLALFANDDLNREWSSKRENFRALQKMVSALLSPPPQAQLPEDVTAPPPKRLEIEANAEAEPPLGPRLVHYTHSRPKRPIVRPPSRGFLRTSGTNLSIASATTTSTNNNSNVHELTSQVEADESSLPPSAPPPPLPSSDLPPPAAADEVDGNLDTSEASSFLWSHPVDMPHLQRHSTPISSASEVLAASASTATPSRKEEAVPSMLQVKERREASQGAIRSSPSNSLFSPSLYSSISTTSVDPSSVAATPGHNDSSAGFAGKGSAGAKRVTTSDFSEKLKKIREKREKRATSVATRESPLGHGVGGQSNHPPLSKFTLGSPDAAAQDIPLSPPSNLEGTTSLTKEPDIAGKTSVPMDVRSTAVSPSSSSLPSLKLWQRREYGLQKSQIPTPTQSLLSSTASELNSPKLLAVSPLGHDLISTSPVSQQMELRVPSSKIPVRSIPGKLISSQPPAGSSMNSLPLQRTGLSRSVSPPELPSSPPPDLPAISTAELPSSLPPDLPSSSPPDLPSSSPPEPPLSHLTTSPSSDLKDVSASYDISPSSANQGNLVPGLSTTTGLVSAQQSSGDRAAEEEDTVVLRRAQQQGSKEGSQKHKWSSAVKRLSLAETRELISASRLPSAPLKRWTALDMDHSETVLLENSLSRETSPKGENLDLPHGAKISSSTNRRSRTGPLHHILDELSTSASAGNIIFNQLGHEPDMTSTSAISLDKTPPLMFHVHTEEAPPPSPPSDLGSSPFPSLSRGPLSPAPLEPSLSQLPPSPLPPLEPPPPLPSKHFLSPFPKQAPSPPPQEPPSPPPQEPPSPPPQELPSPPPQKPHSHPPQEPHEPPPQEPPSPPPQEPPSPPPHEPPSHLPQEPPSPPPQEPPSLPPQEPPSLPPQEPPSPPPQEPPQEPSPPHQNDEHHTEAMFSQPSSEHLTNKLPDSEHGDHYSKQPPLEHADLAFEEQSTASVASKLEKRRTVNSMISTSSLHRKELESGLEPMSTTLDALMVMHEMQDKQIDDNLAEMKRQQILTKDLLEGNVPLMLTAGIIPPSLSEKPQEWLVESVCHWMETVGLGSYKDMFREANIDGVILVQLDDEALVDLGIQSPKVRSDLLSKIKELDSSTKGDKEELALLSLLSPPDEVVYGSPATPPKVMPTVLQKATPSKIEVAAGDPQRVVGKGLSDVKEPSIEGRGRNMSNAAQLKEKSFRGTPAEHPPEEERGLVRIFMDTVQSTIFYKAFAATMTTTAADLIKKALSKAALIEDPSTFYIQQTVLPSCISPNATNHILTPLECPLAFQKNWSSFDGFRFELKRNENARQLEFQVDAKLMTGHSADPKISLLLSPHTPCADVVTLLKARLKDKRRSYVLVEVNLDTGAERPLGPSECPLATKSSWGPNAHCIMKLLPREEASGGGGGGGGTEEKTDTLRRRRPSSNIEKLQAQVSELELEKETLTRHLCTTKVKLQRLESTEVNISSLNEAHQALTNTVKSQQESHRREVQELQGQVESLTLANRQLRELQLVTSATSQGQALGEIQKRYNQEAALLKDQLCAMEKSLQALETRSKQLEEELAGKTREVEQLTSLLSSSKQQVESLERDLGAKEGALRLANLKLKEAESIQNGQAQLSEGDSSKIDTLLATISTLELTLENARAESQRQASELQASRAEMGLLKLRLNDKEKQVSQIQVGSKIGPSLFAQMSSRSPQLIITLELKPTGQGLGIKVVNGPAEVGGCIVKGTAPNCQTDQLRQGDKLLEVNEVDVSTMNRNELGDLLQKSSGSVIRLVVGRLVPLEALTPPRASSSADPKWSSLKHKTSPLSMQEGQETAELREKCMRLQADLLELASSKKTAETEVKQLHTTIQTLSSQLSDAQASLKASESNLSKDKLYLDRLLTIVVEQAPQLLSMMDEGSLESDYPDSDDNSWC